MVLARAVFLHFAHIGKLTPGFIWGGGETRQGNVRVRHYLPVMPATGGGCGEQEYLEFIANLDYIVSMPAWATQRTNEHYGLSCNGSMSEALAAESET